MSGQAGSSPYGDGKSIRASNTLPIRADDSCKWADSMEVLVVIDYFDA